MTIKVHLPCRARGQERVQRCGYAAFCLNSQKGEQQDRRGDYPRISTNPRLGDLHRHRREALRAPGPAAGRRRLPPVAFQGVLGDLVNNQVPPLFRIYIKSDHMVYEVHPICEVALFRPRKRARAVARPIASGYRLGSLAPIRAPLPQVYMAPPFLRANSMLAPQVR